MYDIECLCMIKLDSCSYHVMAAHLFYLQVQKDNRDKRYNDAKRHSEYVVCFNITGAILHVLLVLAVIATALILHFVFDVFS